jgi:hypothetical protein
LACTPIWSMDSSTKWNRSRVASCCQRPSGVYHWLVYVYHAQEPLAQEFLRQESDDEEAQHNWEQEGGSRMPNEGRGTV